jgi:hypothetical protein
MVGPIREAFVRQKYNALVAELMSFRLDTYIRMLDASQQKNPGKIFPFARGLRFSALLIYAIRKNLQHTYLTANWGQVVNTAGLYLSNECDIIIHIKRNNEECWNGDQTGGIMDYRFIDEVDVKVVISCKSYLTSSDIEKEYYDNLKNFVSRIWLFTECCGPRSAASISANAKAVGYEHFFHLYTWSKNTSKVSLKFPEWKQFLLEIRAIS